MENIIITNPSEEYIEAACDISVMAWVGIRKSQFNLMGKEIAEIVFNNWEEAKKEAVRTKLKCGEGFIALCDNKVVGFTTYSIDDKLSCGEILNNGVHPDMRGMGIAGKLQRKVLDTFKENKLKYAKVETGLDDGHAPARKAYSKLGFTKNLPKVVYYMELEKSYENPEYEDLRFEPVKEEYIKKAIEIALDSWQDIHKAYADMMGEDIHNALFKDWEEKLKENIKDHLLKNNGHIVFYNNEIAGFFTYRYEFDNKIGVFGYNSISKKFRGKRIASRMYNFIKYKMVENKTLYAKVTTGLDDGHAPARRAYENTGFNRPVPSVTYFMEI